MNSEIVYLFMFDAGPRFTEEQLGGLLKNPEDFSKYEYTKPSPEEIPTFNMPSIFNMNDETITVEDLQYKLKVQVALYKFGGFSIRVRFPITEGSYSLLHKMTFDQKVNDSIKSLVLKNRKKVESALSKIKELFPSQLKETYRFYYIEGKKEQILGKYKKLIAGLLIDEEDAEALEEGYIDYVLSKNISYDATNVIYVGWESVVMIDKEYVHEQELLLAEIANLQLLELRIYHALLADRLDSATKALNAINKNGVFSMRSLGIHELNVSLGSIYDDTRNILNNINDTAFGYGEWYLSRVYSLFSGAFRLDAMKGSVEADLEAIDKERKFVSDIEAARHESFLEIVIIALIAIEIVINLFIFH